LAVVTFFSSLSLGFSLLIAIHWPCLSAPLSLIEIPLVAAGSCPYRRFLTGQTTFGIFIDFKGAYDRVQHKAMFRVLDHLGIQGKVLSFLEDIYKNSFVSVKSGDHFSNPFHMKRGMRQGCPIIGHPEQWGYMAPISPLLFILFINHILKDVPGGVIPGSEEEILDDIDLCKGGLYVDDLLVMTETIEETQLVIDVIEEWELEWDMDLRLPKCGVMCWSPTKVLREAYEETIFTSILDIFPKVKKYKYLGIWVDDIFPSSCEPMNHRPQTIELELALTRAEKARNCLHQLKPGLFDRTCPIPIKVEMV
jgi:hypothetical protein